jgi:RND superfamily putative drug exporter
VLGTLLAALGALLVLAFVFRSFMAFVPLLMALVAIPTTFLLVWPLASVTYVSVIVQFLVALIGLGIAIDYALLVVVRWREERQRPDVTNEMAVRNAMQHAGTAVVFSGTTVAISLLALLALPVPLMRSIGAGGLLIALVSVAVAVTLLPVVLATIGPRLDWPRNRRDAQASRGWSAWAHLIVRHRWPAAVASRTPASVPARSRRWTSWFAQATPAMSRRHSRRSTVSAASQHLPTGAAKAPQLWS